jgi:hypothetical protein
MLVLPFRAGQEAFALDIRRVREVVALVRLRPISGSPDWLAGLFVYRGQAVPVLDLHRLTRAGECPIKESSCRSSAASSPPGMGKAASSSSGGGKAHAQPRNTKSPQPMPEALSLCVTMPDQAFTACLRRRQP